MLIRNNTAEGGTVGGAVTAGNSGGPSGDAFSSVTVSGTGSVKYDGAVWHDGLLSYKFTSAAGASYSLHTFSSFNSTLYARAYVYFASSLFNTYVISDVTQQHSVSCNGTHWTARAISGSQVVGTTTPIVNTWYRVEAQFVYGASGGTTTVRIYNDSGTLLETITATGGTNASTTALNWGTANSTTGTLYMDDLALSDQGWIGPYVPPVVNTGAMFL